MSKTINSWKIRTVQNCTPHCYIITFTLKYLQHFSSHICGCPYACVIRSFSSEIPVFGGLSSFSLCLQSVYRTASYMFRDLPIKCFSMWLRSIGESVIQVFPFSLFALYYFRVSSICRFLKSSFPRCTQMYNPQLKWVRHSDHCQKGWWVCSEKPRTLPACSVHNQLRLLSVKYLTQCCHL
jgi:hypothetical protein